MVPVLNLSVHESRAAQGPKKPLRQVETGWLCAWSTFPEAPWKVSREEKESSPNSPRNIRMNKTQFVLSQTY